MLSQEAFRPRRFLVEFVERIVAVWERSCPQSLHRNRRFKTDCEGGHVVLFFHVILHLADASVAEVGPGQRHRLVDEGDVAGNRHGDEVVVEDHFSGFASLYYVERVSL